VGYTSALGDGKQIRTLFNSKALPKLNLEGLFLWIEVCLLLRTLRLK
jgi:hypothetical protein